ncbi:tyrosine-type recombinase/integrase [Humibacillus xanthopallidus]|uniref:tyrosine-type recombinase/integrase n=1 Tax=Humibacillus xanthopallidus TaxID=412689 RepID=UPI00384AE1A6
MPERLIVEATVTEVNGQLVWTTPKDHQRRTVPVPVLLQELLEAAIYGRAPDDLLFPATRGGVLRVRAARRGWFDSAAKSPGVEGLNPSELRHTAASLAVHAGAHVLAVQRMLGHEKASMTLDVYSDLFDGDLDLVAERLQVVRSQGSADFLRTRAAGDALRLA